MPMTDLQALLDRQSTAMTDQAYRDAMARAESSLRDIPYNPGYSGGGAASAGATTIASGQAAQDMFAGMRTNWLDPGSYGANTNPDGTPSWVAYYEKER